MAQRTSDSTFRRSTIRRWFAPLVAALLALAALGAVVLLQHRADGYRQAQIKIDDIGSQYQLIAVSPLELVDGFADPSQIATQMRTGEAGVNRGLAALQRADPTPALPTITRSVDRDFAAVNQILALLTADPKLRSTGDILSAVQLGGTAQAAGVAATRAVERAKHEYSSRYTAAETQSIAGTGLAVIGLLIVFFAVYRRWWNAREALRHDALTDPLTGLANRRALISDIAEQLAHATDERPLALALYDLDGFKAYNDTFGHLAGDALLVRAGERLADSVRGLGRAYRLGGDEFCTLASVEPAGIADVSQRASAALQESGEAFEIDSSCGTVLIPAEAASADAALLLADRRMYAQKATGRTSRSRESVDVLLQVLNEKDTLLGHHIDDVAVLAEATAVALGLSQTDVRRVRLAAELHDIGKSAIPDTILNKPSGLDASEWELMRAHTLIGERIVRAAPSLADVAELVRSSHERVDANGYPDGLSGDAIPLGARIVAVCDAFDAMTSPRPYRKQVTTEDAVEELRRCSGTQFDPRVVDAFCALIRRGAGRGPDELAA